MARGYRRFTSICTRYKLNAVDFNVAGVFIGANFVLSFI